MILKNSIKLVLYLIILNFLFFFNNVSPLNNKIIARVGNEIITNLDLKNEINTFLILTGQTINQENVNKSKDIAFKSLIRNAIKKNEIDKYKVKNFNQSDLENYLNNISSNLNINRSELKEFFKINRLDYDQFKKNYVNELLWNTLIFSLYKNQININTIEIEQELKKSIQKNDQLLSFKLSEIEVPLVENINSLYNEIIEKSKKDSFVNVVKKYSISMSKEKNGELGWFNENSLSSVYLKEIKSLKVGQFTKPIKTLNSYVILKLNDKKNYKKDNLDINKLKENIVLKKKEENLKLFSRSHFSNLESSILIDIL